MNRALKIGGTVLAAGALVVPLTACDPFYGGNTDIWAIACFVRNGTYIAVNSSQGNRDCTGMTGSAGACADVLGYDPRIGATHANQACPNVGYAHWAGSLGSI